MRPRCCFRSDGRSKIGLTEPVARARAGEQTVEHGDLFEAYVCWVCGHWHTGRARAKLAKYNEQMFIELGDRAYGHYSTGDSRSTITARFVSAERVRSRELVLMSWKV